MNKTVHKRIMGLFKILFVFIVCFTFGITDVFAGNEETCREDTNKFYGYINAYVDLDSSTLVISRNSAPSDVRRSQYNRYRANLIRVECINEQTGRSIYTFDANTIRSVLQGGGVAIAYGEQRTIPLSAFNIPANTEVHFHVIAESVNGLASCDGNRVGLSGTSGVYHPGKVAEPVIIDTNSRVHTDCTFGRQEACYVNPGATRDDDSGQIVPDIDPTGFDKVLKCPYNKLSVNDMDSPDYYVNKEKLFREETFTVSGQYNYNTEAGLKVDTPTCKVKCEENVTVEFGAPIASKAGLCFEYKVKVKSEVNCKVTKNPERWRNAKWCWPTPGCYNQDTGSTGSEGGPNQEFDNCVASCDGGVYSDRCVNKCYKKIYGKSASKTDENKISYNDKLENNTNVVKVNSDIKRTGGWYYSNGAIHYSGSCAPQFHGACPGMTVDGIPVAKGCGDTCVWNPSCFDDDTSVAYLNGPEAYSGQTQYDLDAINNEKEYNRLKKRCEAYASCSTTTAEFTISVDYKTNGSETRKRINFPYTKNNDGKDTIQYHNVDSTTCTKDNGNSTILASDGCYNCGKAKTNNSYMTEWSFPGAWINNKSGELTFDKSKVNTRTWQSQTNKFCLPLNIKNVNTKWYNYYFAKMHGNDGNISYNDSQYTTTITCPDGTKLNDISCDYRNTTMTQQDIDNIDYNINAIVKNFGFFKWNIDIQCFYAVNDEFPGYEGKTCKTTCDNDSSDDKNKDYRIRTVDLGNLFPDNQGNKLTTTDTTGRTPGFNWTKYSNQTIKDTSYKSLASNYTKWVQAKGYSVYSDDYLDYEVNLTKDLINKLKKRDKNYTAWEGETTTDSVVNYQSPLFRNGGILSGNSHYPNGQALKCNNMKNYKSSECDDFTGEVR